MVAFVAFGVWYNARRDAALKKALSEFAQRQGLASGKAMPSTDHLDAVIDQMHWMWPGFAFTLSRIGPRWAVFVSRMTYSRKHGDGADALSIIAIRRDQAFPDTLLKDGEWLNRLAKRLRGSDHPLAEVAEALGQDRYLKGGIAFWDERVLYYFRYPRYKFREKTYKLIFDVFA